MLVYGSKDGRGVAVFGERSAMWSITPDGQFEIEWAPPVTPRQWKEMARGMCSDVLEYGRLIVQAARLRAKRLERKAKRLEQKAERLERESLAYWIRFQTKARQRGGRVVRFCTALVRRVRRQHRSRSAHRSHAPPAEGSDSDPDPPDPPSAAPPMAA